MKIVLIGSRFFDDANAVTQKKIENIGGFLDTSPFVFSYNSRKEYLKKYYVKENVSWYINFLNNLDNVGEKNDIRFSYDKVVIDILDMRLIYHEYILSNGEIIRVSEGSTRQDEEAVIENFLIDNELHIVEKNTINPLLFSDVEIKKNIAYFVNWLEKNFDLNKVVFLENKLAIQCIDANGDIRFISNYKDIQLINDYLEKCAREFKEQSSVHCVDGPLFNLLDTGLCKSEFCGSSYPYYEYFINSVLAKEDGKRNLSIFEDKIYDLINAKPFVKIKETIKEYSGNRSIVLVGSSKVVMKGLGQRDYKIVDNYSWLDKTAVIEELERLIQEKNNYYWIISRLYYGQEIIKILNKHGLEKNEDYVIITHEEVEYNNFYGEAKDVFNNQIETLSPVDIRVTGWGNLVKSYSDEKIIINLGSCNYIKIDEKVKGHSQSLLKLSCEDAASITVDKRTRFMTCNSILASSFSDIKIGKDCLFSSEIVVKTLNKKELIGKNNNYIEIGDAVWVGYRSYIMSGSNIKSGVVCGARTTIWNCIIPNNCIVAGGRIIRKNVIWDSDIAKKSLSECKEEYIRMTEE